MIAAAVFIELIQKSLSEIIVFMTETFVTQIDLNLEHIMFNDIIVYNISKVITQIAFVTDEFSEI